jgi:hypothetical protein
MSFIPSNLKKQLVSRLVTLDDKIGFLRDQTSLYKPLVCASIFEEVEKGIRECIVSEIFAWHDVDCANGISCNCPELANLIGPDLGGYESED